ncbi:MAG: FAD/NAD(P)-binding oxidoreductase [Acidobacteria bacterium]|nr:MAG: FAD/NAD(P)-binding oxidoreductase [Acidobacteriota bacterium]
MDRADVLVVGGGVMGAAVAARLSQTTARVLLVEEQDDLAEGASKANAGIATSFYGRPGTLEARLIAESNPRWEDLCGRLDVPYRRIGAVMLAVGPREAAGLPAVYEAIVAHGARAELVTAEQARDLEPLITGDCAGGISLPDEGIIDPMRLTVAYAELAARNGATIERSRRVTGFSVADGEVNEAETTGGPVRVTFVVNAAGLFADEVSRMAGGESFRMWPRQGQYWILDRAFGSRLRRLVYPIPMEHTRGAQVVPTTNGSVLLGPSAADTELRLDKATDLATLRWLLEQTRKLVPDVSDAYAIKTYAGNRPAGDEIFRARFDHNIRNLIHVGSRSAGVSVSPALGDHVLGLLRDAGLAAIDRAEAGDAIPTVPRLLNAADPEELPSLDPRYRHVVCACEQVTAVEISAALESRVPATSIDGVRKRTRATGGRCQGSVCMVGVAFLVSQHTGQPPECIRHGGFGGTLGVGHADY